MGRPDVREVCHALREFYPDPEVRRQAHYLFAHRFLPEYFFENPRGVVGGAYIDPTGDCTKYVQARWQMMEHRAGLVEQPARRTRPLIFRRVTDLAGWKASSGGRPALYVQMPEPEESPCAFFVSMVLIVDARLSFAEWPVEANGRILTLERLPDADTDVGVLCEWTHDGHLNHGILVRTTRASFGSAVAKALMSGN